MLNIEISAKLVDLSKMDFKSPLEKIANNLMLSIQKNFEMGGRPKEWANIKRTGAPSNLYKTGAMFNQIQSGTEGLSAWAGIRDGQEKVLPYLYAHQWGYSPRNLSARPYIMFQEEDIDFVTTELSAYIVEFWEAKGTPI